MDVYSPYTTTGLFYPKDAQDKAGNAVKKGQ